MQLTGPEIKNKINDKSGDIIIRPFLENCLGSNSYDLHLDNKLKVYKNSLPKGMKPAIEYKGDPKFHNMQDWFENDLAYRDFLNNPYKYDIRNPYYTLDPCDKTSHETLEITIPDDGLILSPNIGYLGATLEYTETHNLFPYIDGKSSIGRNFILNHHTAGRGDDGFCGYWTLEIKVLYPTVVYPYMRIGQIYYEQFTGNRNPYNKNPRSHYNNQVGPTPAAPVSRKDITPEVLKDFRAWQAKNQKQR